jgi:8-oxo-dGTP diphosphatase
MNSRPTTPLLTVDTIIEVQGGIVLIERKNPPHGWALPGGFVDVGESLAQAAVREAREETSLEVTLREQFFAYSDPKRDPRGATVSVVFLGGATGTPRAADDAKAVRVFALDKLPSLAFDHGTILDDYRRYLKDGTRPPVTR